MRTRLMFPVFMAVGLVVLILASTSNAHAIGLLNIGHGCDAKPKCGAEPKCGAKDPKQRGHHLKRRGCDAKPKCGAEPKCGAKDPKQRGHHLKRRGCDAKPKCGAKKKCGCSAA